MRSMMVDIGRQIFGSRAGRTVGIAASIAGGWVVRRGSVEARVRERRSEAGTACAAHGLYVGRRSPRYTSSLSGASALCFVCFEGSSYEMLEDFVGVWVAVLMFFRFRELRFQDWTGDAAL